MRILHIAPFIIGLITFTGCSPDVYNTYVTNNTYEVVDTDDTGAETDTDNETAEDTDLADTDVEDTEIVLDEGVCAELPETVVSGIKIYFTPSEGMESVTTTKRGEMANLGTFHFRSVEEQDFVLYGFYVDPYIDADADGLYQFSENEVVAKDFLAMCKFEDVNSDRFIGPVSPDSMGRIGLTDNVFVEDSDTASYELWCHIREELPAGTVFGFAVGYGHYQSVFAELIDESTSFLDVYFCSQNGDTRDYPLHPSVKAIVIE